MSSNRKLQTEIDRTLKKVDEGVEEFDAIWEKVYSATQQNQKEKYEGDLKKEIKKLQRHRDSIKSWISSNDIKDKKVLIDARKLIETKMEQFKICEKETKTKAFSKEGLARAATMDPEEQAKSERREWLQEKIDHLTNMTESFEADIERISNGKKKKSNDSKIAVFENGMAAHKYHIGRLEQVMRLMDNDELTPDQVDEIKDDLEFYMETAEDAEAIEAFGEDTYDFYEVLELDSLTGPTPTITVLEKKKTSSSLGGDDGDEEDDKASSASKDKKKKTPKVASTSIPMSIGRPVGKKEKSSTSDKSGPSTPATPSAKSTTATAAAAAPLAQKSPAAPATAPGPARVGQPGKDTSAPQQQIQQQQSDQLQNQRLPQQSQQQMPSQPVGTVPPQGNAQQQQPRQQGAPAGFPGPASATDVARRSQVRPEGQAGAPQRAAGAPSPAPGLLPIGKSPANIIQPPHSSTGSADGGAVSGVSPPRGDDDGAAAASGSGVDKGLTDMLAQSMRCLPLPRDSERPKQYFSRNPFNVPSQFPQQPAPLFENPSFFSKLSTDTLFFIFYYQQGTYQQYLAAKELKRQSWRYHSKFTTWFQRHEEPKVTTDDYEQGTYLYFDYETGWCQRIKSDFVFEYIHLEGDG